MRAIVNAGYGGPEVLTHTELPDPTPADGEVLIRVRAFGLNHAECYFRSGAWGDVAKVNGIECAGTVAADPAGTFPIGATVIAILGGMGRTRNGSYAELVTVPASNVVQVTAELSWPVLAAVPEVYASAWSGLHYNLAVQSGQTVVVRGATSSLGQAAVNVAADLGATVLATTRNPDRAGMLHKIGANEVLIDDGKLAEQLANRRVDAVFDLVGNSVLRDSVACVRPGGRVAQLGFLGGLGPVEEFTPMIDLPTGVQFSFYGSAFVLGGPDYPLTDVPLAELFAKVADGTFDAAPVRVLSTKLLRHTGFWRPARLAARWS
ncbi:MAG TPA: zinc-binding dehydrogenase [Pseudonocardiaceae bacterium]|nr:zinc-binding dehydrogenase [Pseudonocardiaceae bacterium]